MCTDLRLCASYTAYIVTAEAWRGTILFFNMYLLNTFNKKPSMKLKIENWIIEQKLSSKVTPLFEESIKAYKASAYKASLLFSYLGFMTILKERIINSQPPPGITAPHWSRIVGEVGNKEAWDKKVFEVTQQRSPAEIFPIIESLRIEVLYWKDRRNDCAHFKNEKIDYHHVESFWSFLESNLSKFTVNGGMAALLLKFKNHFDSSLTPPGEDFTPLIVEIESAVEGHQLQQFYQDIRTEFDTFLSDHYYYLIFNHILEHYSNGISEELIVYIKKDKGFLLKFLRSYPDKLQHLNLEKPIIRELWHSMLFDSSRNDFPIYAGLLNNNLIESDQIEEANQKIVDKIGNQVPRDFAIEVLKQHGFYNTLKGKLFPEGGIFIFNTANFLKDLIVHYISLFELDEEVVSAICGTFTNLYEPIYLRQELDTFFTNHPTKKEKFNEIIDSNPELRIPERLSFLAT